MEIFTKVMFFLALVFGLFCASGALTGCGSEDNPEPADTNDGSGGKNDVGTVDSGTNDADTTDTNSGDGNTETDGGSVDTYNGDGGSCAPNCQTGTMVTVPAGSFQMGCNTAVDTECLDNIENPYHAVSVPAFKIDKYELTVGEYQACVDASDCTMEKTDSEWCNYGVSGRDSHPINCVDWNQAKAYCAWAGKRLPTEAEWEKAARGTDGRKYPWGNDSLDCDHAVHSTNGCSNSSTAPVGSKPAGTSPYGAEDMVGNVYEWVEDWYHNTYTGAPADGSAWVTPTGSYRVIRGGAWSYDGTNLLRASNRVAYVNADGGGVFGFRCVSSAQ